MCSLAWYRISLKIHQAQKQLPINTINVFKMEEKPPVSMRCTECCAQEWRYVCDRSLVTWNFHMSVQAAMTSTHKPGVMQQ